MKTNIPILVFTISLSFLFSSCKDCKECSQTKTYEFEGLSATEEKAMIDALGGITTLSPREYCDEELDEVDNKTITVESTLNGITYKEITEYSCK